MEKSKEKSDEEAILVESDVPGASINGEKSWRTNSTTVQMVATMLESVNKRKKVGSSRTVSCTFVHESVQWVACEYYDVRTLYTRVNAYIENGWAGAIVDPDGILKATTGKTSTRCVLDVPGAEACLWKPLKECVAQNDSHPLLTFSNSQIITYVVTRTAVDGLPANDLKAINTSAQHLFKCGHVQDIKFMNAGHLAIQAKCIPV